MADLIFSIYYGIGVAVMLWQTRDYLERVWGKGHRRVDEGWPIVMCFFWALIWPVLLAEHLVTRPPHNRGSRGPR